MTDIVVTWPKTRSLKSYLEQCEKASEEGRYINYHVASIPQRDIGVRCYVVHDGYVRGWQKIKTWTWKGERGEVVDPITGESWRPGWYIVRDPEWHALVDGRLPEMAGFQGWRYFDEDGNTLV